MSFLRSDPGWGPRRPSKKPIVREMIVRFRDELSKAIPFTRIDLGALSSRTRILLLKELTTHLEGHEKTVPFSFHSCAFEISFQPNLRQPGNGIISNIGTISEIYTMLSSYPQEKQREFAEKLLNARMARRPYHPAIIDPMLSRIGHAELNLQILNILLDFEIARRLQGDVQQEENSSFKKAIKEANEEWNSSRRIAAERGECAWEIEFEMAREFLYATEGLEKPIQEIVSSSKKRETRNSEPIEEKKRISMKYHKRNLDDIPIASAVIGILKLSSRLDSSLVLSNFFNSDLESDYIPGNYEYKKGTWNAFEGLPSGTARKDATERIIRELNGGINTHPSEIHRIANIYYEIYGGESESEAEDEYEETY